MTNITAKILMGPIERIGGSPQFHHTVIMLS